MCSDSVAIRTLQPDEWPLLKSLRLAALGSDPQSFWEAVEEVRHYDDIYWINFAAKLTPPNVSRMFILERDSEITGFVYGVKMEDNEYRVGGLWVDRLQRGKHYGSELVQRVVRWAKEDSDQAVIQLWCPVGATTQFYQTNGFQLLDKVRVNETDGREIVEMEWREPAAA